MPDLPSDRTNFQVLEHSGDLKIEAWGENYLEALAHASQGIITQIVSLENIRESEQIAFEIRGDDEITRTISFLNELIYIIYVKKWIPKRVKNLKLCNSIACDTLQVTLVGEPIDPNRHRLMLDIKAVTYHEFKVYQRSDKTVVQFVCDL